MKNPIETLEVAEIVAAMKRNSEAWLRSPGSAEAARREALEQANQALGATLRTVYGLPAVYSPADGVWYVGNVGGLKLYDLY